MKEQLWEKGQHPAAAVIAAKKLSAKKSRLRGKTPKNTSKGPLHKTARTLRGSSPKIALATKSSPPPAETKDEDEVELLKIEGQLKKAENLH